MNEFGEYLVQLRIMRKIDSQRKLAELTGLSNGTIARLENGTHLPKIENMIVLSKVLNVSFFELLSHSPYVDNLSSRDREKLFNSF